MISTKAGGTISIVASWLEHARLGVVITMKIDDWKKNIVCCSRVRVPGQPEWVINVACSHSFGSEEDYGGGDIDYSDIEVCLQLSLVDESNNPISMDLPEIVDGDIWDLQYQNNGQSISLSRSMAGVFDTSLQFSFQPKCSSLV